MCKVRIKIENRRCRTVKQYVLNNKNENDVLKTFVKS